MRRLCIAAALGNMPCSVSEVSLDWNELGKSWVDTYDMAWIDAIL
jgi:hypothetical protein